MTIHHYTLSTLLAATGDVAIRKLNRETDIDALARSIKVKGILQNLIGRETPEGIEITDGNRRLAAVRQLVAAGELPEDFEIRVELRSEESGEAIETALHANTQRVEMHPLDEADAYATMMTAPAMTLETIAARAGVTTRRVEQRMALTRLAPAVREAYRSNALTLDMARAYSQGDIAAQEEVFAASKKDKWTYNSPDQVRRAFRKSQISVTAPIFLTVGAEAYEAAGGTYLEDLFEDYRAAKDADLLNRLFVEVKSAYREALIAEGWGDTLDISDGDWYRYPTAHQRPGEEEAEYRARSIAVFGLRHGEAGFTIFHKREMPGEKISTEAEEDEFDGETVDGSTSNEVNHSRVDFAVREAISTALHVGLAARLAADPAIAKRMLIATMALELAEIDAFDIPLDLSCSGRGMHPELESFVASIAGDDFGAVFAATAGLDDLDALLAATIASTLNFAPGNITNPTDDVRPVLDALALDPGTLYAPDQAYFEQFPKETLLGFLSEMKPSAANRVRLREKPQIVAACLREAEKTGWHVPELRLPPLPEPRSGPDDDGGETAALDADMPDAEPETGAEGPDSPSPAPESPDAPDAAPEPQDWTMPEGESLAA